MCRMDVGTGLFQISCPASPPSQSFSLVDTNPRDGDPVRTHSKQIPGVWFSCLLCAPSPGDWGPHVRLPPPRLLSSIFCIRLWICWNSLWELLLSGMFSSVVLSFILQIRSARKEMPTGNQQVGAWPPPLSGGPQQGSSPATALYGYTPT